MTYATSKKRRALVKEFRPFVPEVYLSHTQESFHHHFSSLQNNKHCLGLQRHGTAASPEVAGLPLSLSLSIVRFACHSCARSLSLLLAHPHSAKFVSALCPTAAATGWVSVEGMTATAARNLRQGRNNSSNKKKRTQNEGTPNFGRGGGGLIRKLFPYIHHA